MSAAESSESRRSRGLSAEETEELYQKLLRVRKQVVRLQQENSVQSSELRELKETLGARHSKLVQMARVTPNDFRSVVEAKLHAIRQEIGRITTTEEGKVTAEGSPSPSIVIPSSPVSRKSKPLRIYMDGCFDVMHSGHYNALRQAKALGDILIVGVHTDEEIERNKRKPVFNNEERLAMVKACKWTDRVVFDVPYAPSVELLDKVGADFSAHGDDLPMSADGRPAYGDVAASGRLKIFKRTPGVSTTMLIDRLCKAVDQQSSAVVRPSEKGKKSELSWSQFLATSHRISAFSNHRVPSEGDRVVYIDGIWDLFHPGHVAALKAARSLGDFLYVGVYEDYLVQRKKGVCWPMMNTQERVLNLLSCRFVDEVVIGCPWKVTRDMVASLNLHCVCFAKHVLLSPDQMDRYLYAREQGILTELTCLDSEMSTMSVVKRIISRHDEIQAQNAARISREMEYTQQRAYVEEFKVDSEKAKESKMVEEEADPEHDKVLYEMIDEVSALFVAVHEEVELSDFDWDSEEQCYLYPCPCGDEFTISLASLLKGAVIAHCESCSLKVRVLPFDMDELKHKHKVS